jgi:hypothetical protein
MFQAYWIAVDEGADVTNTAQLAVLIRGRKTGFVKTE